MYLGALILLYRQSLAASADVQPTNGVVRSQDLSTETAKRYRDECVIAGQQIARILQLISFDGTLTKRCWIIM
jgi:hypothetical protein